MAWQWEHFFPPVELSTLPLRDDEGVGEMLGDSLREEADGDGEGDEIGDIW